MTWVCVCNNTPCDGLDCGVPIPGRAPRRRPAPKTPEQLATIRAKAWATHRAQSQDSRA